MAQVKTTGGVVRKSNTFLTLVAVGTTLVVGLMSFIIPPVASAISYGVDRITNGMKEKRELKALTKWYAPQIGKTLGINPADVTLSDFKTAAQMNPALATVIENAKHKTAKENRSSLLMNSATALIPGGKVAADAVTAVKALNTAKTIGAQIAASTGAGMFIDWVSKKHIDAQEVMEGIHHQYVAAIEAGKDPKTVVTPQMVFLLRVAQDPQLEATIKEQFGKPFQQMNEQEMNAVMMAYKPLADAVTSEARAVAMGIMPAQELMAREVNLNGSASRYAMGSSNSSFAQAINEQRSQKQNLNVAV